MKAQVHVDGGKVWETRRISAANLEKKVDSIKRQYGCLKMTDAVRRNFKVFVS